MLFIYPKWFGTSNQWETIGWLQLVVNCGPQCHKLPGALRIQSGAKVTSNQGTSCLFRTLYMGFISDEYLRFEMAQPWLWHKTRGKIEALKMQTSTEHKTWDLTMVFQFKLIWRVRMVFSSQNSWLLQTQLFTNTCWANQHEGKFWLDVLGFLLKSTLQGIFQCVPQVSPIISCTFPLEIGTPLTQSWGHPPGDLQNTTAEQHLGGRWGSWCWWRFWRFWQTMAVELMSIFLGDGIPATETEHWKEILFENSSVFNEVSTFFGRDSKRPSKLGILMKRPLRSWLIMSRARLHLGVSWTAIQFQEWIICVLNEIAKRMRRIIIFAYICVYCATSKTPRSGECLRFRSKRGCKKSGTVDGLRPFTPPKPTKRVWCCQVSVLILFPEHGATMHTPRRIF